MPSPPPLRVAGGVFSGLRSSLWSGWCAYVSSVVPLVSVVCSVVLSGPTDVGGVGSVPNGLRWFQ